MQLKFRRSLTLPAALLLFFTNPLLADAADENVIAAWVQYTVGGVEARAVVRDGCPAIRIDGRSVDMVERAAPTALHNNTVCAAELPRGVRSVRLNGGPLPLPVEQPKRIVIMGDTGCRLSKGHGLYQECNNDSLWPFAHVAKSVEAAAPDLIIYTGDYIYREDACLHGDKGCENSPYGKNQATWEADWFIPAKPVHAAAPLVLIRGNHETCKRAGTGWFRYLDARPPPATGCKDSTDPWVIPFNAMQVAVMDVANTKDRDGKSLAPLFTKQLELLDDQLHEPAWIAAHRPFWGFGADDDSGERVTPTKQLQDAVREAGLPDETRLLIGAHIHLAEVLDFGPARPPQLVVANSGTQLVPRVDPPDGIDGVAIQSHEVIYQYGFVTMSSERTDRWSVTFNDLEGRELERCLLYGKRVRCGDE